MWFSRLYFDFQESEVFKNNGIKTILPSKPEGGGTAPQVVTQLE